MKRRYTFRPPDGSRDIERYDEEKQSFVPDDGEDGIAFSAKDERGFPMAYYWRVGSYWTARGGKHPNNSAAEAAMQRTCARWSCANGYDVGERLATTRK